MNNTKKNVEEFVYFLFRSGKMAPIIYYMPPSPPCRTILILSRIIDLQLDLRMINIMEGEHMKKDFLQVS